MTAHNSRSWLGYKFRQNSVLFCYGLVGVKSKSSASNLKQVAEVIAVFAHEGLWTSLRLWMNALVLTLYLVLVLNHKVVKNLAYNNLIVAEIKKRQFIYVAVVFGDHNYWRTNPSSPSNASSPSVLTATSRWLTLRSQEWPDEMPGITTDEVRLNICLKNSVWPHIGYKSTAIASSISVTLKLKQWSAKITHI
jgi:hypothetical protein